MYSTESSFTVKKAPKHLPRVKRARCQVGALDLSLSLGCACYLYTRGWQSESGHSTHSLSLSLSGAPVSLSLGRKHESDYSTRLLPRGAHLQLHEPLSLRPADCFCEILSWECHLFFLFLLRARDRERERVCFTLIVKKERDRESRAPVILRCVCI